MRNPQPTPLLPCVSQNRARVFIHGCSSASAAVSQLRCCRGTFFMCRGQREVAFGEDVASAACSLARLFCFLYFNPLRRSLYPAHIYASSRKYLRFPRHLACGLLFFSNAAHFRRPLSCCTCGFSSSLLSVAAVLGRLGRRRRRQPLEQEAEMV
jgi:hypothetical protein